MLQRWQAQLASEQQWLPPRVAPHVHRTGICEMSVFAAIKDCIFAGEDDGQVDVEAAMAELAGRGQHGWRSSLIDFLRALEIDPSYANRRELALEMGLPRYQGTRDENLWLLKAVMAKLASEGARVPAGMLD